MNFQQIRDSLGTMDGDYQAQTEVVVTVKRVKDVEFSKKGKKGQSLVIELDGEEEWVKFTGRGVDDNPLDHNAVGNQYVLKIWPFKPDQSPKTYLYCWIQRQVSQGSSQQSQQATQQPNPVQGVVTDTQILAFAERVLKVMESLACPNTQTDRPTQQSGQNPEYKENPEPIDEDDDIPF